MFSQVDLNDNIVQLFLTKSRPATAFKIVGGVKVSINTAKIAGDINNDGYDDIIVGSITADAAGAAYVIYGKATGGYLRLEDLTPKQGFKIDNYFDYSGYSVDRAGDVNGDGYDDVIIGASNATIGTGISYVIFGRSININIDLSKLRDSQGFSIIGSGHSVSGAGDTNGDGFDDVIIGLPNQNLDAGISYVILGSSDSELNTDLKVADPSIQPTTILR